MRPVTRAARRAAHPRAGVLSEVHYRRYLALRDHAELGPTLRAIEALLCELEEPVSSKTMAILVCVPAAHCESIARELGLARRPGQRVDWHGLIDLMQLPVLLQSAAEELARPAAPGIARAVDVAGARQLRLVSGLK